MGKIIISSCMLQQKKGELQFELCGHSTNGNYEFEAGKEIADFLKSTYNIALDIKQSENQTILTHGPEKIYEINKKTVYDLENHKKIGDSSIIRASYFQPFPHLMPAEMLVYYGLIKNSELSKRIKAEILAKKGSFTLKNTCIADKILIKVEEIARQL